MGQQIIYVEGLGFIPIQSGQTPQQAIATAQQGRGSGGEQGGSLGIGNPMGDQSVGFNLPPVEGGDAADIFKAFPQIAGLFAQFTPMGKAGRAGVGAAAEVPRSLGYLGQTGLPMIIESIRQALSGEKIDPVGIGVQGAFGAGGKIVGDVGHGIGNMGEAKIVKALGLTGDASDAAIEALPKMAIREGARLTKKSEGAIRAKAKATASGGLEELADTMGKARRTDAVSPSRMTFWPQEAAANWARRPPRQMAMGQKMARPFGAKALDTRDVIAPTSEAAYRSLLALIASQLGEEPPLETSRGPRRRGQ